jgi:hypothetical protein
MAVRGTHCISRSNGSPTKEALADARPQALQKLQAYSVEYVEDFSGPRTKQMPAHRSPH